MRNGVLAVLGVVTSGVLGGADIDGDARTLRDSYLDYLQDHIHDVNAYVRSKSLQTWLHLLQAKAVPLPRHKAVLERTMGRLKDRSSLVRKGALQLLTAFLTENPFAAKVGVNYMYMYMYMYNTCIHAHLLPSLHSW